MIELACPACRGPLDTDAVSSRCVACANDYPSVDGIHRLLSPARAEHFSRFLDDYTSVRRGEGRASADPEYFRRLPEPTPGGPIEWQWRIRRHTWATVRDEVIAPLSQGARSLVVVDVGAGVGWLSNRLSELGHESHAVDLTVDAEDGLGAARHFEHPFARYQAEMDALPFADGSADLVVFNASLHYSTDYERTLREALRVLRPEGRIVVMETPIYGTDAAGRAMVAERHASFEQRFGTRSDSIESIEYLTPAMLAGLERSLGVLWHRHRTWYGWRWAWRPWSARLHRRRPPSAFAVLVARRAQIGE
jgi:ubiquinone/menaquinone biosynthesis C-methylase UbiE/uncharacterized protein YbaR (Trm112 family)